MPPTPKKPRRRPLNQRNLNPRWVIAGFQSAGAYCPTVRVITLTIMGKNIQRPAAAQFRIARTQAMTQLTAHKRKGGESALFCICYLDSNTNQNSPITLPSSARSSFSADGTLGKPSMVITSPHIMTTNSARVSPAHRGSIISPVERAPNCAVPRLARPSQATRQCIPPIHACPSRFDRSDSPWHIR